MSPATPRLERPADAAGAAVRLLGDWTALHMAGKRQIAQLEKSWPGDGVAWDLREANAFDHVAAQWLWDHWGQRWPERIELLPGQRAILERVARFTTAPRPRQRATPWTLFLGLGGRVLRVLDHVLGFLRLVGQLGFNILRLLRAPHMGPWRDFTGHIYRIGATAMPITALVGFLIGVVLAYLTAQQLRQFGADAYIVNILGIALIRELGPMLAAILIAGRSGSAITAQIGVMRVTEELDAMRVMGISHSFRLVMPRALALAIVMPLISTWTTLLSLAGGMLAADFSLDITPQFFVNQLPQAVALGNLGLAVAKSVVFGILIALVGCHFGLRVEPNTQSLGEGTTASVVTSITVVILVDALFAVLFKNVGF